jgi:hypothetical protein
LITYQTKLYKAVLKEGWNIAETDPIFQSHQHKDISEVFHVLHSHEPLCSDWFAVLIVRRNGKIIEEEIYDTSVLELD